mmetsp:Transcript_4689/g.11507  ORF Transcript_4689/g.11507 Transcript_4689/m.11507 type:complete len:196 (-) Transcript_4689:114-701(-)
MALLWQQFRDSLCEWHGPYMAEGRQYFVNQTLNVSSWEDPRVEAQYLCELQSALIAKLQTAVPPQSMSPGAGGTMAGGRYNSANATAETAGYGEGAASAGRKARGHYKHLAERLAYLVDILMPPPAHSPRERKKSQRIAVCGSLGVSVQGALPAILTEIDAAEARKRPLRRIIVSRACCGTRAGERPNRRCSFAK